MRNAKVFAGSSHPELAALVAKRLGTNLAPIRLGMHHNHEISVELGISVRNQDIFIIQSGSDSMNDHLIEMLATINSCRTLDAWRITAVIPFLPYARQCKKKNLARSPITAKLIANMLCVAGVDHIITMDLHQEQTQGFFNKPVDNMLAEPTLCKYIIENVPGYNDAIAVSKNPGGVKRVTSFADRLKIDFALIHKDIHKKTNNITLQPNSHHPRYCHHQAGIRRSIEGLSLITPTTSSLSNQIILTLPIIKETIINNNTTTSFEKHPNECQLEKDDYISSSHNININKPQQEQKELISEIESADALNVLESIEAEWREDGLQLVGNVDKKVCFIVDDIIDKSGSFIAAATLLINRGATKVVIIATHGLLSIGALEAIEQCPYISEVIVTNSYPISLEKKMCSTKLRIIDISPVLAEAIRRTHNAESISYLFHTPL